MIRKINKILCAFLLVGCSIGLAEHFYPKNKKSDLSFACLRNSDTYELYSSLIEQQETNTFQNNYYSNLYFNNLRSNFGNNLFGSCTYVSIGMLLSFYDSYWNDSFVPEQYDVKASFYTTLQSGADFELPPVDVDSPGIAFEPGALFSNLTEQEYLETIDSYSNTYFHLKLLKMGEDLFGLSHDTLENTNYIFGMSYSEMLYFLEYYLYTYRGFSESFVSISSQNGTQAAIKQFIINKINDGIPVIVRAKNNALDVGHSFVAYDYDPYCDEIYVHTGWRDEYSNSSLTHISLNALGFTELWDATTILPLTNFSYPMNYISSSGETLCSSNYIFPQNVRVGGVDEYCRDKAPTFVWDSLYHDRWSLQYSPYFRFSILNKNKQAIFSTTTNEKSYTLTIAQWQTILNDPLASNYYVYLQLDSNTYPYWDDFWSIKSFKQPRNYSEDVFYIDPGEYGFADAYPSDYSTENNYLLHNVRGLQFATRRYRTGYIQNEYVVMSPIRKGFNKAFIEFKFGVPITKIEVELSHWREFSYEWLSSSTGTATVDAFINGSWVTKFDMLSSTANLPTNRSNSRIYTINFGTPVYNFRFYSNSFATNTNNNNRGRICIGTLAIFPDRQGNNISDQSESFATSKSLSFDNHFIEKFQTITDIDYYKYVGDYTNYIRLEYKSTWESSLCTIEIFRQNNLFEPELTFEMNQNHMLGLEPNTELEIYVEQGETIYFKISHLSTASCFSNAFYLVALSYANYADCSETEYASRGYISELTYVYNGSRNIYIYFDQYTYEYTTLGITYRSAVLDAMAQWNKVGSWQWIETNNESEADVTVTTFTELSVRAAYYSSIYYQNNKKVFKGELYLNEHVLYNPPSYGYILFACVHELGHGLGLGHIDYDHDKNVMNSAIYPDTVFKELGQGVLAVYRYLWG